MTCNSSDTQWKTWIEHIILSPKTCVLVYWTLNSKSNMKHLVSKNLTSGNKLMSEICNFTSSHKKKYWTCTMKNLTIKLCLLINVYKNAETKWLLWMMCREWPTVACKISTRESTTSNNLMLNWIKMWKILRPRSWTHKSIIESSIKSLELWISCRRGFTLTKKKTRCLVNISSDSCQFCYRIYLPRISMQS